MDIEIKKMTSSHIGEIARLEKECFSSPWSEDGLKTELDNNFAANTPPDLAAGL